MVCPNEQRDEWIMFNDPDIIYAARWVYQIPDREANPAPD